MMTTWRIFPAAASWLAAGHPAPVTSVQASTPDAPFTATAATAHNVAIAALRTARMKQSARRNTGSPRAPDSGGRGRLKYVRACAQSRRMAGGAPQRCGQGDRQVPTGTLKRRRTTRPPSTAKHHKAESRSTRSRPVKRPTAAPTEPGSVKGKESRGSSRQCRDAASVGVGFPYGPTAISETPVKRGGPRISTAFRRPKRFLSSTSTLLLGKQLTIR